MSDNDRKNPYEMKQDHEHRDSLEKLTRTFNSNRQNRDQNDQSSLQTDRSMPHPQEISSHDDFDLSFLEAEFESNLTNDMVFDDQEKQWNSQTISDEPAQYIPPITPFPSSEQNSSFAEERNSSPMSHDEEQILDALSPLPIQKSQSPQSRTAKVNANSLFEKSTFNAQSEDPFLSKTNKQGSNKNTQQQAEQYNRFSQTVLQQENVLNVQQNYGDNKNFYENPVNRPYKVSADQENWVEGYYGDTFPSSTEKNMFSSASELISREENTVKDETTSDFPSTLDSTQANKQSDLKDFWGEGYNSNPPKFYEEKTSVQEAYTEKSSKYHNAPTQYINNFENISDTSNAKEFPVDRDTLNDIQHSSKSLNTKQKDSFFTNHNYTYRNTPPPNVYTDKFAEEIVEKTGPIMVPEVPYEAPEYNVQTDGLKEEFADVLNVGNVPAENFSHQPQHNEIFNEIFHNTTKQPRENVYSNFENQNANYFPTDNIRYDSSSFPEKSLYRGAAEIPTHISAISSLKNFVVGKTRSKNIVLLVVIAIGIATYSHFFVPSQKNATAPIIRADNTPFKFKQETTETKNDLAHNLYIYKQNGKQENTQKFLIDNSEQPEDLPESNQQISSSSHDESDVEDVVIEATNHTIPTREVQTVVVNEDGTFSLVPMHHTDKETSNSQEKIIDQTDLDKLEDSSPVFSQDSDLDNEETENNLTNDIDNIITKNTANSNIEKKVIPIPSQAERNSRIQTHAASRPTESNRIAAQNTEIYYVQLASQPTHVLARDSLRNMKFRFGFLIGDRPLNIHSAFIPGKGTYYRVRIQMQNRNKAIALCENIKGFGGNCFVTR
ncbi:SPOR domain-containing protein [Bartonella sp. CB169]|uniref:SPOR domain-containing protein n=1 Tax=Bartonella sp. CB169 TaxID=3112257 RepID=UPI00300DECC5